LPLHYQSAFPVLRKHYLPISKKRLCILAVALPGLCSWHITSLRKFGGRWPARRLLYIDGCRSLRSPVVPTVTAQPTFLAAIARGARRWPFEFASCAAFAQADGHRRSAGLLCGRLLELADDHATMPSRVLQRGGDFRHQDQP